MPARSPFPGDSINQHQRRRYLPDVLLPAPGMKSVRMFGHVHSIDAPSRSFKNAHPGSENFVHHASAQGRRFCKAVWPQATGKVSCAALPLISPRLHGCGCLFVAPRHFGAQFSTSIVHCNLRRIKPVIIRDTPCCMARCGGKALLPGTIDTAQTARYRYRRRTGGRRRR